MLDTHALVWWVSQDARLSDAARDAIDEELRSEVGQVAISAITLWEIAMLQERGRLALAMALDEWLAAVESIEHVVVVPISARVAVQSTRLPGDFHKDPADRLIVALARELNAPLLTADEKIHSYVHVRSIW